MSSPVEVIDIVISSSMSQHGLDVDAYVIAAMQQLPDDSPGDNQPMASYPSAP